MTSRTAHLILCFLAVMLLGTSLAEPAKKDRQKEEEDPYAEFVWPPPPDEPRIKLEDVFTGRADIEAESKWKKALLGASPQQPWDRLRKPHAVEFDSQGRILVTDWGSASLLRFDRANRAMDVFGKRGAILLKQPLGIGMGPGDVAFVADVGLRQVIAFDSEGKIQSVIGKPGDLENPTDAAVSPDGTRLFVSDSKQHRIVVFDLGSGDQVATFGKKGEAEGEFLFPSSLTFGPEGDLFVVDQINTRIQVFDQTGDYIDGFGEVGTGFGSFVRPKDVAVDEVGFIYVTDNAFNNVQVFDADFSLLTFVGEGGGGPGRFHGASGVAVRGEEMAVVDQLGHKLQVFRYLIPKTE